MKKIVLNMSDSTFERLRFESIAEQKSVQDIIRDRILLKPFSPEVEQAFQTWIDQEMDRIIAE